MSTATTEAEPTTGTEAAEETSTETPTAASAESTTATEQTFTQAQVDDILSKRIGRERTKFESDLKTLKERSDLDEVSRLKAELEDRDKALSAKDQAVITTKVETRAERAALAAGVKPERIDRFMKLLDLDVENLAPDGKLDADAINAAVEATLTDVPEFKGAGGTTTASTSGADFAGAGGATKTFTKDEIAAMSEDEFEKNEAQIMAQMKAGLVK